MPQPATGIGRATATRPLPPHLLPTLGALAVLLLGALAFAARLPVLTLADASIYGTTAQALVAGHGLRLLGYVNEPLNTFTPPGYSLALAALIPLQPDFPASLPLWQLANLLTYFAFLALSAVVLCRGYGATPTDTTLAVLLAATPLLAFELATRVLSDSLYAALALGSVLLVGAGWARPGRRGLGLFLAGLLLAALAYYTRSAGMALVAAVALDGLRRARQGPLWQVALTLVPGLLALPWMAWTALSGGSSYLREATQGTAGWVQPIDSPLALAAVVGRNLLVGAEVLWVLAPALAAVPPVTWVLASALFLYAAWQSARAWWRGGPVVHLYLLLYLGLLLLLPYQGVGRYIWPVAPLLAWYLVTGLRALGRRIAGGRVPLEAIVVGLLLLVNVAALLTTAPRIAAGLGLRPPIVPAEYAAMLAAADYLRRQEPTTGVLGTNHLNAGLWWHLYTGRQGIDALARADGAPPQYVPRAWQGDPDQITYFVYHRANGSPGRGEADLPVLLEALAARGADPEPRFCSDDRAICIFDWRPSPAATR
jgi:hypothetical protein